MDNSTINHLSLCSGLGGIDLGLRTVLPTCRTVAYVEIEAFATANLVNQMEKGGLDTAPVFTDLHRFPWGKFVGLVDIISGGFPCQPFSHAGNREGVDDPRHLWPKIAKGIDIVRPAICFFENVDGIVSAKSPEHHSVLHHVLCDLEELGYIAAAGCYTAAEVGAPHQRKRWFILGLADRDSCGPRQPRRANGELPEEGEGLRGGENQGQAGQEPGGSRELADADSGGGKQDREPAELRAVGSVESPRNRRGDSAGKVDEIGSVADGDNQRLQGFISTGVDVEERRQDQGLPVRSCGGFQWNWPALPGEQQHDWEPPRTLEPSMGGDIDAEQRRHRVDRLRLLGNAVVPQCAALAFTDLMEELLDDR